MADLRAVELLADVAPETLRPVAEAARERSFAPGDRLLEAGAAPEDFLLVLEGEVDSVRPADPDESVRRHVAPTYLGAMSVLSDTEWPVSVVAATAGRVALVPATAFFDLLHADRRVQREVTRAILTVMRRIEAVAQRQERLASLGTLSAGLAHELNNPAAAARRTVDSLAEALETVQRTLTTFVESGVERAEAERLVALQREAVRRGAEAEPLDILDASEREDRMAERLEAVGIDEPWTLAEPLAAAGLDEGWLHEVVALAGPAGPAALRWVAASLTARGLADELREATDRISGLVAAVKEYSYMDQAAAQDVDVHSGLESTLTILGHKLGEGSIEVVRDYERELPRIPAFGSELNQVWTNLLDNAIDALAGRGTLTLRTRSGPGEGIVVEIEDTGPGIPPELRDRVFEPFFTTKEVGQGSGLGLDTARRIVVDRHRGTLDLESTGSGTAARVVLPATS